MKVALHFVMWWESEEPSAIMRGPYIDPEDAKRCALFLRNSGQTHAHPVSGKIELHDVEITP